MARVTVEDCTEKVPNRFELVHVASLRAKQIRRGARIAVDSPNREVVTALREIAAGIVQPLYDDAVPDDLDEGQQPDRAA